MIAVRNEDSIVPSFGDSLFWNSISHRAESKPAASATLLEHTVQLEAEEVCIAMHLICTICRAVVLAYNVVEKQNGMSSDNSKSLPVLTFSELISVLPTGSTSDIANALLEGIEYGMVLWIRRYERLSFSVPKAKSASEFIVGPAVPAVGAFRWVSQNLPDSVEELFIHTLSMLTHSS